MDEAIKKLFERYQAGKATPEEIKLVEDWFARYDARQNEVLNKAGNHLPQNFFNEDGFPKRKPSVAKVISLYLKVAAAVLLFAGGTFALYRYNHRSITEDVTYTNISAPNGSKKSLTLADGTVVYLNSGSLLRIPSNYNTKTRAIELSGEAYFVVKHNAAMPFSIKTGKLTIADIGTSFNVRSYPEDKQIKVAVETGIVKINGISPDKKQETLTESLIHDQQFTYNNRNGQHTVKPVLIDNMLAWKKNQLRFDNASFTEMAQLIERWYGVKVELSGNGIAYTRKYTVSFYNEPLEKVLSVLREMAGINYQINNKTVFINLKTNKKA